MSQVPGAEPGAVNGPTSGALHHIELWVPDLDRAVASLGWLLEALGHTLFQNWDHGRSWRLGPTYLVVEQSPALTADRHDRCRPGLNHLAFHVEDGAAVERLAVEATRHGWHLMFPDRHPHAGGAQHYAAYLENDDGFEVELVEIDHGLRRTPVQSPEEQSAEPSGSVGPWRTAEPGRKGRTGEGGGL